MNLKKSTVCKNIFLLQQHEKEKRKSTQCGLKVKPKLVLLYSKYIEQNIF
jgi:hypothetical protein